TTTQIQTNMQHEDGPPWTRSPMNTPERATEEALLHRIYRCRRRGKHRAAPHGRRPVNPSTRQPLNPSTQLGRPPLPGKPPHQLVAQAGDSDAILRQRIPVPDGHRPVLQRLVVDRHAPGGADLVLAAVTLADRAALVVLHLQAAAE